MCIISSRPSNLTKNLKGVYFCPPFIIYRSIVDNYVAICFCFAVMISHGFPISVGTNSGMHVALRCDDSQAYNIKIFKLVNFFLFWGGKQI